MTRPALDTPAETRRGDAAGRCWAVVLAAGDGTRLRSVTTLRRGVAVPKQYCALNGGASLLRQTLRRASRVVPRERIVVVVAADHRRWWTPELADLPPENIVVQPANKGTAAGILLPLLSVLSRDPQARLLILPSDHFVADEQTLGDAARAALERLAVEERIVLLGIAPEEPATGFGWIVPASAGGGFQRVLQFVEKPELSEAHRLLRMGAVWNSFLFAVRGAGLLRRYQQLLPELAARMARAFARERADECWSELRSVYSRLEPLDFSREVLQRSPDDLEVLTVDACGWDDLGTPERVVACLRRSGSMPHAEAGERSPVAPINLSLTHGQLAARPAFGAVL